MRATFHAGLDELMSDLASMVRLTGLMMTNASIALHQSDLTLADLVIAQREDIRARYELMERRCVSLLALQAPVAGDLRVVVSALRALGHARRMGNLAGHVAVIAQTKHPNPMTSGKVRPVLARMSLLASGLAADAASAIEFQDPLSGCRLAAADDEVDALLRHLFGILFAPDWSHGVEHAVDAALIGRYYERFGDHAVAIAAGVCYRVTGEMSPAHSVGSAGRSR
ncbi:MAG TPA: PhoU domain-containing protein [Pseudonocardiaceae bacterium]|nr:PhoU domain-containing protein [Pseudonocardiaceae bacterium]